MQITLKRLNKTVLFEAQNERGHPVLVDKGISLRVKTPLLTGKLLVISQAALIMQKVTRISYSFEIFP